MGLIVPTAAEYYQVEVTEMAAQFTWFTGAGLIGQFISFFIFDYFSIKRVMLVSHLVCGLSMVAVHLTVNLDLLAIPFFCFGIAISTALCGASTLISQVWDGSARHAAIVGQDAMFNGGGVLFAAMTSWFLAQSLPFSSTYLVTFGIIVFVVLLMLISDFTVSSDYKAAAETNGPTEWNSRIILIGVSLLLYMMAKISVFIWAPQYITEHFEVDQSVGGEFMSNVFSAALIGSIAGTWLVSRVDIKYLVYGFISVSLIATTLLTWVKTLDAMLMLAFVYGISVSATFNAYVAFSLAQVKVPTHRNIAYMLLMSALGSSFAPLFSSIIVEKAGSMETALVACAITLFVVALILIIVEILSQRRLKKSIAAV
jgi:MFS transporter, TsgA protein